MKKYDVFALPLALMMLVLVSRCGNSGSSFDKLVNERRSVRSYDATKSISEYDNLQLPTRPHGICYT